MPKSSEEQAQARRDEIVNACAELYETMSFRDITLKEIGQRTSFTRTSIYNYFETREEIFLALTQREYEAWTADLNALAAREEPLTAEEFASALARTLERRSRLLKLMAMNLYDMEANTRLENLVAFKKAYRSRRWRAACAGSSPRCRSRTPRVSCTCSCRSCSASTLTPRRRTSSGRPCAWRIWITPAFRSTS